MDIHPVAKKILRPPWRLLRRLGNSVMYGILPALAPIVRYMAVSGAGTDACLRRGSLPLPVHYYSPVPDLNDLRRRGVWQRRSDMAGIDLRPAQQLELLVRLGQQFGDECAWPAQPTADNQGFYTENCSFGFWCAAALHGVLRSVKPRRVIEVGSGNSSRIIAAALELNRQETGTATEYSIIDPYPRPPVDNGLDGVTHVFRQPVETTDLSLFTSLEENDVLFIDSGHTVRTGSDVNFEILDILPRLAPGVWVHFHDIPLPFEYPEVSATNPRFRVFWTEAYLLQAFLSFNQAYEIMLTMCYLLVDHLPVFRAAFPHYDPQQHLAGSGSFWIRRTHNERNAS